LANAANLVNFGTGGLNVGDWTYSAYPLTAPAYLPLTNDTASYLTSSYPTLGAIFAPTTVAYSAAAKTIPKASVAFNFLFGNNTYMGWNTTGDIITSPDCTTWTSSGINTNYFIPTYYGMNNATNGDQSWMSMTYGNGKFVAARAGPAIPGINFSGSTYGWANSIGGTAVSYDNGVTWVQGSLPNLTYTQSGASPAYTATLQIGWRSIGFGNGVFVAIGYGYNADVSTQAYIFYYSYSPDGVDWSTPVQFNASGVTPAGYFTAPTMAFGNGKYVAVNQSTSSSYGQIVWVGNGPTSWSQQGLPTALTWNSVAFGNGVFVAVGGAQTSPYNTTSAATSPDGVTWTARTMPASLQWVSVAFANGYFVAVGQNGSFTSTTSAIATSTDGITWTLQTATAAITRGIVGGGNGKFIYQDSTGSLASSTTATLVSISASASSFTLPMPPAMRGVIPYMKAT